MEVRTMHPPVHGPDLLVDSFPGAGTLNTTCRGAMAHKSYRARTLLSTASSGPPSIRPDETLLTPRITGIFAARAEDLRDLARLPLLVAIMRFLDDFHLAFDTDKIGLIEFEFTFRDVDTQADEK